MGWDFSNAMLLLHYTVTVHLHAKACKTLIKFDWSIELGM